jgi:pimeloyl-ACP methyl ester carboxylesterase
VPDLPPPAPGPADAPRTAPLSDLALPTSRRVRPPWPGEQIEVRGGPVFVRHTPWTGPVGSDDAADGAVRERALYVHGLGGASTNWTDLAGLLAVRFEGWSVDLPGFGRSQPPARGYSVHGHGRAVVDMLEHVRGLPGEAAGRPVHLLGNSLGGLVSLLVAASRPELVASLTLVSPAMPVYRVPPAFSRALLLLLVPGIPTLAERRISGIAPEEHVRSMIRMCFGDPKRVPRERLTQAVEEMRERAEQPWADRALTRSMRGLITSYLRPGRTNAWRLARGLRPPTLVVWGTADKLVDPALAPRLAAAVPDARLQLLDGVGHVAQLETPEPVARAVLALAEDCAARQPEPSRA